MDGTEFDYCHGVPMPGPSIVIGNRWFVGKGVEFNIRRRVTIGDRRVTIGDHSLVAAGVRFIDHNHGIALGALIGKQSNPEAEIHIRRDVWIGADAIILMGVTLDEDAVIAAGAVVTMDVPSNQIWGGVPARQIGERCAEI